AAFARLDGMRDDGKPALFFAPHLANWELPALAARSAGINFAAVFRRPNLAATAETIIEMRAGSMGAMIAGGLDAPFRIARALENDPEKWTPVFGKDHAQPNRLERDDDSKKSHHALGRASLSRLDAGPQPIHQPLGLLVMGRDGVETRHHRIVGIHIAVIEDR